MKKIDISILAQGLGRVGNLTGAKFCYSVARNIHLLKSVFTEYEEQRVLLAESMAEKDKDGKPKINGNQYVFENQKLFDEEFKKLNNEEVNVKLFIVDYKDIPEGITAGQLTGIFPIIKDEETPKVDKIKK